MWMEASATDGNRMQDRMAGLHTGWMSGCRCALSHPEDVLGQAADEPLGPDGGGPGVVQAVDEGRGRIVNDGDQKSVRAAAMPSSACFLSNVWWPDVQDEGVDDIQIALHPGRRH